MSILVQLEVQPEVRVAVELLLYSGKSVLLAGAPGTGKTWLAFELSRKFTDLDPVDIVGHGDLTSRDLLYTYEPQDTGFRVVLGKLALSVMASWARLMLGLPPRWLLFDELNRMNAEIVLGDLFTALDITYRGRIAVVPQWLVKQALGDEGLLDEIATIADVSKEDTKSALNEALNEALKRSQERGLSGLPLPYSWRALATINLLDRSHLFRLGFALLRRFPLVMFPGLGLTLQPEINVEALQKHINHIKAETGRVSGIYDGIRGLLLKGNLCAQALKELRESESLTAYDKPCYIEPSRELIEESVRRYEDVVNIVALIASRMSDVGVELGHSILIDACRLLTIATLYPGRVDGGLLTDTIVTSLLLPQLGSIAPRVKAEILLGGSSSRVNKVSELLSLVEELLGSSSMASMYVEALRLEIPIQSL